MYYDSDHYNLQCVAPYNSCFLTGKYNSRKVIMYKQICCMLSYMQIFINSEDVDAFCKSKGAVLNDIGVERERRYSLDLGA